MTKRFIVSSLFLAAVLAAPFTQAQTDLGDIEKKTDWEPGKEDPVLVSLSGFSGEVAAVIQFDLYVQGFKFVKPDEAQFLLSGSNNGNVQGRVTARITNAELLARGYTGESLRRQAHSYADDVVKAVRQNVKGIGLTRIAYRVDKGRTAELMLAEFDGNGASSLTGRDNTLVASPCWQGNSRLFYSSWINSRPQVVRHDLGTGARTQLTRFAGSNLMPAPSPDGSKVAMILSKDGSPDLYVLDTNSGNLLQLTDTREEESSPTWHPSGRWICFATKKGAARMLARVSPTGGTVERISTAGVGNPTEPDWSPDGKWIAFTTQHRGGFDICVVPADGGPVTPLVAGEDPSWAPNSRTLVYARRSGGRHTLSLLDVPTKQFKDVPRISGSSNSQPAWAR